MSFWGKLGHIALKAAPIAAGFIPGVGPLASMAIGGLAAGADKKLSGGSWKDSLMSGGIGAGTGYLSGKLGDMSTSKPGGIGPSKEALNSPWANAADAVTSGKGTGVLKTANKLGTLGKIANTALAASPLLGLLGGGNGGGSNLPQPGGMSGGGFGSFESRNPDVGAALERGKQRAIGIGPRMTPRYSGAY